MNRIQHLPLGLTPEGRDKQILRSVAGQTVNHQILSLIHISPKTADSSAVIYVAEALAVLSLAGAVICRKKSRA